MNGSTVFVATVDLAGHLRGRAVPAADESAVLEKGTGWVPADLAIAAFGQIVPDNPFGASGDLRLIPDPATVVDIPAADGVPGVRLYLADQQRLDGTPWACCPRTFLKSALADLRKATGLHVVASFEHEFFLPGLPPSQAFSFRRLREAEPFGTELIRLLTDNGLEPETWLPEYGRNQFEITLRPASALVAADRAVVLKELVRDLAFRHDLEVSFAPVLYPDSSGNGVHVHLSLQDESGEPVLHDPTRNGGLSEVGAKFAAGLLRHAPALSAWTTPGPVSHLRLGPQRWSAAGVYLADRDREALVRICPIAAAAGDPSRQYNLEYRAADATANPWLTLGVLIRAGLQGIVGDYPEPHVWPEGQSPQVPNDVPALPKDLAAALDALEADDVVASWFDPRLLATQIVVKRHELTALENLEQAEQVRRIASVY